MIDNGAFQQNRVANYTKKYSQKLKSYPKMGHLYLAIKILKTFDDLQKF